MCGRYEDSKEIVSKNDNGSTRRTFVFLVLFSVTLSALGISCFALLTVQKLSNDLDALRFVLRKSRVEPAKQQAYGLANGAQRAAVAVGSIYETPSIATIQNLQRLKRSLDAEQLDKQLDDSNVLHGKSSDPRSGTSTFSKIPPLSFENVQQLTSDKKSAIPINNENRMVETGTENSEVEFTPEFRGDKRGNFDTSFQTNGPVIPSIENVKLISDIEGKQRTAKNYDGSAQIPNPLKKDVETFIPLAKGDNLTEKHDVHHILSLPRNPDIPSIIEEMQNQMDHHIKKKAVNYDDDEVESFTPEYKVPHNVYKHRQRGSYGNTLEIIDEFSPQAGRLKSLIAIHLNGDTSQYMLGVHTNYKGNGHLRHVQKTFVDWKVSDWVETISATNSFHVKNGVVTVKESGLYFVYAQIYYLDEHDSNGYAVHRNSENILHCKVTAPSSERLLKGNTCFTGGVVYLDVNDKISIDDISDGRYTLFVPGYSFFGMIKLGDIKGK